MYVSVYAFVCFEIYVLCAGEIGRCLFQVHTHTTTTPALKYAQRKTHTCAGLIHIVENEGGGTKMLFHEAFYFIITTVSTVGYGDFSPRTTLGRMLIVLIIVSSLVVIPLKTGTS